MVNAGVVMFFVKAAFWIFLILLLMPSNDKEKSDFYVAAGRTMSDLGSFCGRNPDVCDKTGAIFDTVVQKVRTTIEMLEDIVRSDGEEHDPYSTTRGRSGDPRLHRGARSDMLMMAPATTGAVPVSTGSTGSQDTLRPDDLEPAWRGPGRV
jgi:hypothetical protein